MGFENIPVIEEHQFYIDMAFRRAKKSALALRSTIKKKEKNAKSKEIEMARISSCMDILSGRLYQIVEEFPSINELNPFYNELIKLSIDYDEVKKSLASIHWAVKQVKKLGGQTLNKIKDSKNIDAMNFFRKSYYGRISSILKEINPDLKTVEAARREIVKLPVIKEMPTVCITGFPNVGKSTLLSKLTTSKPDIQPYAFTTKALNLGYKKIGKTKVQFIDTPGTLARKDKRNQIEKISYLAMEKVADIIIYVWDVTEPYPVKDQEKLFNEIKQFKKPIIEFVSKSDIADKEKIKEISKKRKIILSKEGLIKKINFE